MNKFYKRLVKKIKKMRKDKSLSQEQLSVMLKLNRSTLSLIEKGEGTVKAEELKKLAEIFNISIDILLDLEKEPIVTLEKDKNKIDSTKKQIRINVPQKNISKFKEVLLYILNKIGGKENIGESVLCKTHDELNSFNLTHIFLPKS